MANKPNKNLKDINNKSNLYDKFKHTPVNEEIKIVEILIKKTKIDYYKKQIINKKRCLSRFFDHFMYEFVYLCDSTA